MTNYLGPVPFHIDIYATKGILWRKAIQIPVAGVPIDLADHIFRGSFSKKPGITPAFNFTFDKIGTTCWWKLTPEVSNTVPIGYSADDPASKFHFDVLVSTATLAEVVIIKGILTLSPKSTL